MILCPNCSKDNISVKKDKEISYCSACNHYVYNQLGDKEILFSHDHVGDHQQITRERQYTRYSESCQYSEKVYLLSI